MLGYIGKRVAIMAFMLILTSLIVFIVIELPPGDFVTMYVQSLENQGYEVSSSVVQQAYRMYGLDKPFLVRYLRWLTSAILRLDLGRSMAFNRPVIDILRERVPLTMAFSAGALLLSWMVAIPIGVFSAAHQYSAADYLFTFLGFLGLGTPGWLLALILGWFSISALGFNPLGLTSVEYIDTPWSWAKFVDMLGHLWFPIVLTGISTTGQLIRTVRNNLLDELQQQYVTTARAKGLPEWKVIIKYPARLAISPVISSVGYVLPQMFGGLGIIAVALQIPTVFPVLNSALRLQDMHLAGAILLALSLLTMIGTLLSDILLAVVDPRIRLGGGTR